MSSLDPHSIPDLRRRRRRADRRSATPARREQGPAGLTGGDAAQKVYVAPGQYDEFYAFLSGGFSGQVAVYGLPSGRLLKVIPVFSVFPENGYGYNEETKTMLNTSYGFIPWDDSHHTALSQTDGVDDGRWLFINGNNTPRIARIDLTTMETSEIIEIPNAAGNHGSPFITQNSEYVVSSTRFSVPVPNADVPISDVQEVLQGADLLHPRQRARQDGDRLPDDRPRLQLRPRPRRQGPERWLDVPHHVQHRAGQLAARGERVAEGQGLHRRRELEGDRELREGRQGQGRRHGVPAQRDGPGHAHRAHREGDERPAGRAGGLPRRDLLPADPEVAARRRRRSDAASTSSPAASSPRSSPCTPSPRCRRRSPTRRSRASSTGSRCSSTKPRSPAK